MSIAPGTRLAHYTIVAPLGVGGMGEVYRATDTRLGRDVAIKVLSDHLAQNAGAEARFAQEARAVAALSHPNIVAIHDVGAEHGLTYAVMELLEGTTLRQQLRETRMVASRAVSIALQIAEGLAAAHARGVVHRDLKPENIFLTSSGQAKILDFGLARLDRASTAHSAETTDALTAPGTLLGTIGYMSPEQIRGEPVGPATDIFSFGCVLYEMLGGQGPFLRSGKAESLAAALRDEPARLVDGQNDITASIEAIVLHCLEKQSTDRFQSARDMAFALRAGSSGMRTSVPPFTAEALAPPARTRPDRRRVAGAIGLGAFLGAAALGLAWRMNVTALPPPTQARLSIVFAEGTRLALNENGIVAGSNIAISRDGRVLAYVSQRDRTQRIVVRAIDKVEEQELRGTEGARSPVFSPDGRWIAFFTVTSLNKIPTDGGTPSVICLTPPVTRGATWADNGTIYFTLSFSTGIWSVDSGGGKPRAVTTPVSKEGESNHLLPEALPGSNALLFTVWKGGDFSAASIWSVSLQTGERKLVLESASAPRFMPPGYLVFSRAGALFAQRFDPDRLQVSGEAVPMVDRVLTDRRNGSAHYALATNGTLVYVPGGDSLSLRRFVWVDRQGRSEPIPVPANLYGSLKLCPDGRRVAVENVNDIWVGDVNDGRLERVSFRGVNQFPVWTPDGVRVTFSSSGGGADPKLLWNAVAAASQPEALTTEGGVQFPSSWSPDGKTLAYAETAGGPADSPTGWDIWLWRAGSPPSRTILVQTTFNEDQPMFSPGGRLLAYVSDETERREVYLRSFPDSGRRVRVSADGGTEPVWSRRGDELFYRSGRRYYAVRMTGADLTVPGPPTLMFEHDPVVTSAVPGAPAYDVAPDGKRFIMLAPADDALGLTRLDVAIGWTRELDRRLQPPAVR